jgi:hypothetical protein
MKFLRNCVALLRNDNLVTSIQHATVRVWNYFHSEDLLLSTLSWLVTEFLFIHHLQRDISFHGSSGTRLLLWCLEFLSARFRTGFNPT